MNAVGQVVGYSSLAGAGLHAFSWTSEGGMIDLGILDGCIDSEATMVSASGQVFGHSGPSPHEPHVFSWTPDTGMIGLGGGSYGIPYAVNNRGQAVGSGITDWHAEWHATLWQTRIYSFSGFYKPVDMGGAWNTVKGGATVPLKFEVSAGSTDVTDVSVVRQPLTAVETACDGSTIDDLVMVASGATTLRYDGAVGQFVYNWQTPRKPGACYLVTVTLMDGTSTTAKFKLR